MNRTMIMVGVAGAFAACVTTDDVGSTSAALDIIPRCPRHGCDTNAATIGDGILFDELDLSGQPSAGGVRIGGAILRDHTSVTLGVQGDRLVAFEVGDPLRPPHTGDNLDGMMIWLFHGKGPGEPEEVFWLRIRVLLAQTTDAQTFWAGAQVGIETYDVAAWRSGHRPFVPDDLKVPVDFDITVCRGELLESNWASAAIHTALLYQGDHLDARYRNVTAPASRTLFNLACMGTAMAKLHLLRHTDASNHGGVYPTDFGQRTAMLKMLNADYCGTGESFTIDGHPLRWQDSTGYMQPALDLDPLMGEIETIEAIWGPTGAQCLDRPRHYKYREIMARCPLPACGDVSDWSARGHVISANPPPRP